MYLKRLELKGFKSFADRTVLDFNNGVACVVGPNGSGKSNITDAVRWVLGEQKVKTLRGAKMEDIIFNGTTHRSALGMAEVSLHFDNTSRFFPVDYAEVIVTRRIYKSGESEYLLNNTVCRLKDVREMFMDTGIGTDGYSIIGQGKIESILSGSGDDRRQVFEEAAGIVKYKAKKKEAVRKLENTELNLVRVEDIAGELKGRIEPLRRESEKAKEYLGLTEELKDIEINLFLNEFERIDQKLKKTNEDFTNQSEIHEGFRRVQENLQDQVKQTEAQLYDFENTQNEYNTAYREKSDAYRQTDGEIGVIDERVRGFNNEIARLELEIKNTKLMLEDHGQQLEIQKSEQSQLAEDLTESRDQFKTAELEYNRLSEALRALSEAHEGARSQIIQVLNEIERNKSDSANIHENKQRYGQQQEVLRAELDKSQKECQLIEESLVLLKEELSSAIAQLEEEQGRREQILKEIDLHRQKGMTLQNNRQSAQVAYEKTKTELRVLRNMEESMEGFDYGVKNLVGHLKKTNDLHGYVGVVADLIQIPEHMETAIDISLGKGLQNIVCTDKLVVKRMIETLKQNKFGRVTFLPLSNLSASKNAVDPGIAKSEGFLGLASELVHYDDSVRPAIEYLLGRTLIFKDYDSASKALRIKSNRLRMVTLEGDLLIPGGAITGGSNKQKSSGVLNRKSKIEQLANDLTTMETAINTLTEQMTKTQKDLEQCEVRKQSINLNLREMETQLQGVQGKITALEQQLERQSGTEKKLLRDEQSIYEEIAKLTARQEVLESQLADKMALVSELEKAMKVGSSEQEQLSEAFQNVSEDKTNLAIKLAGAEEKYEGLRREIKRIEMLMTQSKEDLETKAVQKQDIHQQKQISLNEKDQALERKLELQEAIEELKSSLTAIGEEKDKMRLTVQGLMAEVEKAAMDVGAASHRLHALEIEQTKWTVERENVVRSIETQYEMTLEEAGQMKKPLDEKTVNQRAKQIKSRLKELGDVNVGSIHEYEEVSERYHFLREQMDDLIKGQNVLKKMIKELDTTMKEQFVETFEAIRGNFSDVFKLLFNGGSADLKIADEENVLESDIEIYAQPPGKKLQNLNLLSGGEKSLTAIALLFSTLKYKPAPFCMLDEIEAALDDVNVYRFAEFLKAFSTESQFVVITHRKGTMEIADILYGVTMEEYGVSKIVSVKLEDVAL